MAIATPPFRKLRGYAFDPSLSSKIDTAYINLITYKVPWEEVEEGPRGEYLEIIDYDPTTQSFYQPVDLNHPYILAQDGLPPSESNPQFHQEMCYAVAMTTIKNFEKALGRPIIWSPHHYNKTEGGVTKQLYEYVKVLRIYPHAFRDANAYYTSQKKAVLFGYFVSQANNDPSILPDSLVFTCLSHDIITHEVSHAILDSIHSKYIENTNLDVLAFHEAIADIVALFQHFTFPEVLAHQISATRGDLSSPNLLVELAKEFGTAIGKYGALRDAIGERDEKTHQWKPKIPTGNEYKLALEPHDRGAVLVSAIFEAFLTIYKNRIADLHRIASGGSGILPEGSLHPDLINRFANEASKAAQHVLTMCIRALDYCPPVDITFGDFLRAIITSDLDLVDDDNKDYRIAFIDAFRKRGIFPKGIRSLSEDSLRLPNSDIIDPNAQISIEILSEFLREFSNKMQFESDRNKIFDITLQYIAGKSDDKNVLPLHSRIAGKFSSPEFEKLTGLVFGSYYKELGIKPSSNLGTEYPSFFIQSLKFASRVGPTGKKLNQIIVTITQNAYLNVFKTKTGEIEYKVPLNRNKKGENSLVFSGGVTLIFDLDGLSLKYCLSKPIIDQNSSTGLPTLNRNRLKALFEYLNENQGMGFQMNTDSIFSKGTILSEPFAALHK